MTDNSSRIGAWHLADQGNITLYEPQRSNNFEFVVTGLDGLRKAGSLPTDTDANISNAQAYLRMAVNSAFVPHFSQGKITIKKGNTEVHFAGTPTFDSGDFVIDDFIGGETKEILLAWQALSCDIENETVGFAADYKKDAYLIECDPSMKPIRQWKLKGCWISNIREDAYSYDTNGNRRVTATITYDRGTPDRTAPLNV